MPEYKPVLDNIYEQEYKFGKKCPDWCYKFFYKAWPPTKVKSRVEKERKNGNLENMIWRVPTKPKFSIKKGPLDFIYKLWKSEKRIKPSTLVIDPKSAEYDIGPYCIDLWCYLKTELSKHWKQRT